MSDYLNADGTPKLDCVHHADALELLRALPDGCVSAIITDPPYAAGSLVSAWRSPDERFNEILGNETIQHKWIVEAYRVLKNGSALYVFATWRNFHEWSAVISSAGFTVKNCIVWDKMVHGLGDLSGQYGLQHEFIIFAAKGRHIFNGIRPVDVIRVPRLSPERLTHPYEKPIGVYIPMIKASTSYADLIIDPFTGSGASLDACRIFNRHYIGCDISGEYVELARARLAQPYTPDMFDVPRAPIETPKQRELFAKTENPAEAG